MPVKFLGDRLPPGHALRPNEGIKSKNGRVKVVLQTDGNCVLYGDNRPLWWTGVRPGVDYAIVQTDGNFVLYIGGDRPGHQATWSSNTQGHPGAFLVAQDDGNLVLYAGSRALWSSQTSGFRVYGGQGKPSVFKEIASTVEKIPVVGDVVHIAGEAAAAPFHLAIAIGSGERLDHALVGALKDQLKIVKDVAPYAQTVVSLVPGLGTGVAMAIGAGAALAEGQSITEAAKAAIKGALPGGPLAAAAFDVATKIASGENVAKAALEGARNLIPPGPAQKAFDVAVAVATGEKIQTALAKGLASIAPGQLQTILAAGEHALATVPGLSNALKSVPIGGATQGFKLAAGLLSHSGLNEKALISARSQLPPDVQQGFDVALKSQEPHIAWLKNVTSAPMAAAAPQAPAASSPDTTALQQLAKLTPDQQKQLVAMQQLSKLTPAQQQRLVAKAKAAPAAPTKVAAVVPAAPAPAKKIAAKAAPTAPSTPAVRVASRYAPYPQNIGVGAPSTYAPYSGSLSAPPHGGGHGHGHGHGRPDFARGRALVRDWGWSAPWSPEVVTTIETCRTWGDPIEMPVAMEKAARMALGASQGRPSTVRGPDNVLYLFAFENGALTARPCAAVAGTLGSARPLVVSAAGFP